ncbi:MAG: sulfatase-like hydrolase/transferase [Planctomycetaceae bacterium]
MTRLRLRLGWSGLLALSFAAFLRRLKESGAVPADEFAPAVALYAAIPFLGGAGAAAILLHLRGQRWPGWIGGVLAAGSLLWPPLLWPAAALLVLAWVGPLNREDGAPLAAPSWARSARVFPLLAFFGAASFTLLGLLEAAFHLAPLSPRLIPPADLRAMLLASPGLGALYAIPVALLTTLLLAAVVHLLPLRAVGLTLLLSQASAAVAFLLLRRSIGDEMSALGMNGLSALLLAMLCGGWFLHAHRPAPGGDRLETARVQIGRVLAPFGSRAYAPFVSGALAILASAYLLYPELEDFRAQLLEFLTHGLLLLLTALLATHLRVRGWAAATAAGLLVALALLRGLGAADPPGVRLVAREYSRLGALAEETPLARALDPFPRLGTDPPPGVAFPLGGGERFGPLPAPLERIAQERPLLVLLLLDAVRPDHLACYGYARPTSAHLDRLAAQSVRFTNAYSNATATTAGVRMLMSGRYASRYMLAADHPPFFVRELSALGYDRFVMTVTGSDRNGVSRESFLRSWPSDGVALDGLVTPNRDRHKGDGEKVEAVLVRLAELRAARGGLRGVFAFVHLTGAHSPWFNEDPVAQFGDRLEDLYDGEIAKVDRAVGRLLEGLGEAAIVIATADHGTGLREHGRYGGFQPYEEQARVPLLIRVPGLPPRVVEDRTASIDIAPTLLHLLSPGAVNPYHGRSMLPLLTGEAARLPPRPLVSLSAFNDAYALLDGRYKLYHHRGRRYEALYDLEADPGETRSLVAERPEVADRLRALLDAFLWQGRGAWGNPYHYRRE